MVLTISKQALIKFESFGLFFVVLLTYLLACRRFATHCWQPSLVEELKKKFLSMNSRNIIPLAWTSHIRIQDVPILEVQSKRF